MKVLIIGSGGREHALAWKIAQSNNCKKVYVAPGNAGTAALGQNLNISVSDFEGIAKAILEYDISMLIIGPEDPLVNGLRDYLQNIADFSKLMIIGPDAAGAQLEGSKDFSKIFMEQNQIPTASFKSFTIKKLRKPMTILRNKMHQLLLKLMVLQPVKE